MLAHGHPPLPSLPASPPRPTVVPTPNLQIQSTGPPPSTTTEEKQKRSLWRMGKIKSRMPPPRRAEPVERVPLGLPELSDVARLSASNLLQQVEMSVARQEEERAMIQRLAADASATNREDDIEELAGFSHRPTGRDILPPQFRQDFTALLTESRAAFAASTDDVPTRKKSVKREKEPKVEKEKRTPNRLRKTRPKRQSQRPSSFRAPSPPPLPLPVPTAQLPLELHEQMFGEKRTSLLEYDWLARSSMLFPSYPPMAMQPTQVVITDKTRRRRSSVPTRLPSAEYTALPIKPQPQPVRPGVANRFQRARSGSLKRGGTTIAAAINQVMAAETIKPRSPRAERQAQAGTELRVAGWLQRVDAPSLAFRPASVLSEGEEEQDVPLFGGTLLARANSDASVLDPEMHSLMSHPTPFGPRFPSSTSLTSRHTPVTARSPSPTPSSHLSSRTTLPPFRSPSPTAASLVSSRTFGSPTPTLRPPGTAPRLTGRISPGPPSPGLAYDRSRSPSLLTVPTAPLRRPPPSRQPRPRPRTNTSGSVGFLTRASSESGDSELASLESPRDAALSRPRVAVIDVTSPFSALKTVEEPRFIYKTPSKPKLRAMTELSRSTSPRTAMTSSVYSDMSDSEVGVSSNAKTIQAARLRRETLYKRTAVPNRLW